MTQAGEVLRRTNTEIGLAESRCRDEDRRLVFADDAPIVFASELAIDGAYANHKRQAGVPVKPKEWKSARQPPVIPLPQDLYNRFQIWVTLCCEHDALGLAGQTGAEHLGKSSTDCHGCGKRIRSELVSGGRTYISQQSLPGQQFLDKDHVRPLGKLG
jgi:hypothetical protein